MIRLSDILLKAVRLNSADKRAEANLQLMSTHTVDARNLMCPMPVIRVQDAVAELEPGETVVVSCTDPGALNDIPAWCRVNGHKVIASEQNNNAITITIEVGG